MKHYFFFFFCLAVSTFAASVESKELPGKADWKVYYDRAVALKAEGKLEEALSLVNQSMKLKPDHFDSALLHGSIDVDMIEDEQAIKYFTMAMKLKPSARPQVLVARSQAYERLGKFELALADLKEFMYKHPEWETGDIYRQAGSLYAKTNQPAKAVEALSKAIKLSPDVTKAHGYRADCYIILKKYQAAADDYSAEIKNEKMPPRLLYSKRANAYRLLGQKDKAARDEALSKEADLELFNNAPFVKH